MNKIKISRLKDLKIVYKLTFAYLLLGVITVITVAFVSYYSFEKALKNRTFDQLSSINILKKNQLELYFEVKVKILEKLADSRETIKLLLGKESGTTYSDYLDIIHANIQFESIMLLDNKLEPVFFKDSTLFNILEINKDNSRLNNFLESSLRQNSMIDLTGELSRDFEKVSILSGIPVLGNQGEVLGVIVAMGNHEELTSIVYQRTGMGETGESYIVGKDLRMRTRSRFFPNADPYQTLVNTPPAILALDGEAGQYIVHDYRSVEVFSVFRPLEIKGVKWALISEIDKEEALQPIYELRLIIFIVGFVITLVFFLITTFLARKISKPIVNLNGLLKKTSKGIIPEEIPEPEYMDEVGEMNIAIRQLVSALEKTSEFALEIGNGNFEKSYEPLSEDDVLGHALIQMRDKLKVLTENEIRLLKENSLKLMEGQEDERKRISRELHDGLGQLLTATRFRLGEVEGNLEVKSDIKKLLDETIFEVRRISNNLMPSVLIDFGLKPALEKLISQVENTSALKISLIYEIDKGERDLPFEVSTNVYRIVQEALNNTVKYAFATEAEVAVFISKFNIAVEIADNGKGFDVNWETETRGLKNMKERVNILKGTFSIKSKLSAGTVIYCEIPLNHE